MAKAEIAQKEAKIVALEQALVEANKVSKYLQERIAQSELEKAGYQQKANGLEAQIGGIQGRLQERDQGQILGFRYGS
jgi:hypothetical protein